jgi:hypothetical protein
MLRDLDTGTESPAIEGLIEDVPALINVARPYLLYQQYPDTLLFNIPTGETRVISHDSAAEVAMTPTHAAYTIYVPPTPINPYVYTSALKLIDLASGTETIVADNIILDSSSSSSIHLTSRFLIWQEQDVSGIFATIFVRSYDLQSGAIVTILEIKTNLESYDYKSVDDIGALGILLHHTIISNVDFEQIEFIPFEGPSQLIDEYPYDPVDILQQPRLAGRFVVYAHDGNWTIYDTSNGTRRTFDPFSDLPTTSNPAP